MDLPKSDIFVGIKIFKMKNLSLPNEDSISENCFNWKSSLLKKSISKG